MSRTIICFGDSNTHGYNPRTKERFSKKERWTGILQELLGENYDIKEEGLCGRTTVFEDPLFEGLCGFTYLYPCLMTHEPVDLLIIMLGTNDIKERFSATPENIARGMERLIQKAKASCEVFSCGPKILVVAPPPVEPDYVADYMHKEMGAGCLEKSRALPALYQAAAKSTGCFFLDASKIDGMELDMDHVHLSPKGHWLLAQKLAQLIPELTE